jgi:tryptophanyl-tRNA synthetase
MTTPRKKRVLSGMRPTGAAHLGHLVGAFENWVQMQDEFDTFYCIVDWHALTTDYADTSELRKNTRELALDFLAVGLDPNRSTLFIQSHVPLHAELHLLLSMVVPLPWLERVPTYKEQIEQLREKELNTYGFLGYPLLQAADILIYRADFVPVGEDQKPHVELTREIARRFNNFYGNVLSEPDVKLTPTPKLPGTDGRKMSKSYGNTIGLAEDEASVRGKLKTMMTDPARKRRTDPGDPAKCPVFDLHKVFSTEKTRAWASEGCRTAGIGCIECKAALADHLVAHLEPIAKRRHEYERRPDDVRDIFVDGAGRASEVAESTMADVREAVKLPPMGSL